MATWPARFEGRLGYEIDDYADRGFAFDLDRELLEAGGPVVFRGQIEWRGQPIELEVVHPDVFPFLRPEVYAPGLRLDRHQNPHEGNLCLLDRSTRAWDTDWTGARLVAERVPYLLDLLEGSEEALRAAEVPQGEPASVYFGHQQGSALLVPAEFLALPPSRSGGRAVISFAPEQPPALILRGLLREARTTQGDVWGAGDTAVTTRFSGPSLQVPWARLSEIPSEASPEALFAAARSAHQLGPEAWHRVQGGEVSVVAVVVEEEIEQGEYGDVWLAAVKVRAENGESGAYVVHGDPLTRDHLAARTPALRPLAEKTVALVGAGALGSPLALQLAQAQLGRLRVLDYDRVETGNIVRWVAGLGSVGFLKADVLARMIALDYPFTQAERVQHQIGFAGRTEEVREPEWPLLEAFLEDADLLIDATAEIGIQQLFAELARTARVPQIYLWATEGALGGVVARIVPASTGCWYCLQLALQGELIPPPPLDAAGTTQPRGCETRTFTGAHFDLLPLVSQAARIAADVLGEWALGDDVAVLAFDENGRRLTAPYWRTHRLAPNADCPACGGAGA